MTNPIVDKFAAKCESYSNIGMKELTLPLDQAYEILDELRQLQSAIMAFATAADKPMALQDSYTGKPLRDEDMASLPAPVHAWRKAKYLVVGSK